MTTPLHIPTAYRAMRRQMMQERPLTLQQRWIALLRSEIGYLHRHSLDLMAERGILPPFYGGRWLGEEHCEVLTMWRVLAEGADELGLLLIRPRAGIETNRALRLARSATRLANTWPLAKILQALGPEGMGLPIEGGAALRQTKIALALFGEQCVPAPGFSADEIHAAFEQEKPFAVFIHIPVEGNGETFRLAWNDVQHFRAEVVYGETPEDLEIAVWRYRLDLALREEREEPPMLAPNAAGLAGVFDLMVMDATRFYGLTTAVQDRQHQLDILRGLDGDLVVGAPLKAEVEPVTLLAEMRADHIAGDGDLLRIDAESALMTDMWPQIRAHSHYCLRLSHAKFEPTRTGQPRIRGYRDVPLLDWIVADSLPELYERTTLHSLRQMLAATGYIRTGQSAAKELT